MADYQGMYRPSCHCPYCKSRCKQHMQALSEERSKGKRKLDISSEDELEGMDATVSKGISVVVQPNAAKPWWRCERYAVRREFVNDILSKLRCGEPQVDCFADRANKRWPRHWGEGGEFKSAWDADWGKHGLLWCNPPYDDKVMTQAVRKLRQDNGRAVMILPDWDDYQFYSEMWPMVDRYYFYDRGSRVFELEGREMPGTNWGVWALLMDGTLYKDQDAGEKVKRTSSSRRRHRRLMARKKPAINEQAGGSH